jgi:hypothetical protein
LSTISKACGEMLSVPRRSRAIIPEWSPEGYADLHMFVTIFV